MTSTNVSSLELEPKKKPEVEIPNRPTERQDLVTGEIKITFRGKYHLEVLPANVADIEMALGNVLASEKEHDNKEMEVVRNKILNTEGFTKSDEVATEDIEAAEKSNDQLVVEDDRKVRDLFLDLVNQMDVWPRASQKKIRKLTDDGNKFVQSEFVTSFKNSEQNRIADNVQDHWTGEQNCFVVSDATAIEITKTFDSINNKTRYGYKFNGEKEDVMILNLNGVKVAFIIDGGHRQPEKTDVIETNK